MNSLGSVVLMCVAIGAVTVGVTLTVGHTTPRRATTEYGKRLMTNTPEYLERFIPNRLACSSCHIDAGTEPGELSLVNAVHNYPRPEDRINLCVTRNMNGRPLPENGDEMTGMVAWLRFLAEDYAATGASERKSHDPARFVKPARTADPKAGAGLFGKRCADCHGKDGAGLLASRDPKQGYLFPPLWGLESWGDASEMADATTAARFIKAKMPLGQANLTDDEAWDLAAFVEIKPRPHSGK